MILILISNHFCIGWFWSWFEITLQVILPITGYSVASVICNAVTWSVVAKRCVLEHKLLLRVYWKSYMRNRLVPKWMTLTFVYRSYQGTRSRQPFCYIWRWISRKPLGLEIEAWFQRTTKSTNRKWYMGYRMVTCPMTSCDLERSNSWPQYA